MYVPRSISTTKPEYGIAKVGKILLRVLIATYCCVIVAGINPSGATSVRFWAKKWAFDCSCFEESGLPSNPVVLAWAFTAAEATALDYSCADSVSKPPYTRTDTLLCYVAVLSRSLLLAIAVLIYILRKKREYQ